MNKYSKNTVVWGIVTVIYFIGMLETIVQGYAGWIPVLLFVPFIISLAYTWINAKNADIFMWHEDEYK
ncbi:hypothetical protein CJ191_01310 [Aerococcus viridans]|uniref:Uncharacterized protein n=1 Tax=Aerococcus viridans TaxID=1377 RepID=A0A2N6UG40_9LACT|nr:hypothetical protein [Aerococcus viridans]PMC80474.1 hypothetical protein CJ191_01310 [Aerococcus viridans]